MTKIAIVVGISKYDTKEHDLPACKNDAENINKLLNFTGKYDEVLCITDNTTSDQIMSEIDKIVNKYKDKAIDELFFYFSGHGNYTNNEFFYITSDVNPSSLNSTSIGNSILDTALRELNPELFVKVIDACHSGASYIKEIINRETQKEIIEKSGKRFKNCYFLASSTTAQKSSASDEISLFTKSIYDSLISILNKKEISEVKYRDLITALSDYFSGNEEQTPYFVLQGPLSEIFFYRTESIEKYIKEFNSTRHKQKKEKKSEPTKADFLKQIPTKEKITEIVESISNHITSIRPSSEELTTYDYLFKNEYISNTIIFNKKKIGEWISENKNTTNIFARETYEPENPLIARIYGTYQTTGQASKSKYILSGFESNAQKEKYCFKIEAVSEKLLPKYCCQIAMLFSITKAYIFYSFYEALPKNWEEYEKYNYNADAELNVLVCNIFNGEETIIEQINTLLQKYNSYMLARLEQFLKAFV